nr:hypothetical protein [Pseudomonadota bacterium]
AEIRPFFEEAVTSCVAQTLLMRRTTPVEECLPHLEKPGVRYLRERPSIRECVAEGIKNAREKLEQKKTELAGIRQGVFDWRPAASLLLEKIQGMRRIDEETAMQIWVLSSNLESFFLKTGIKALPDHLQEPATEATRLYRDFREDMAERLKVTDSRGRSALRVDVIQAREDKATAMIKGLNGKTPGKKPVNEPEIAGLLELYSEQEIISSRGQDMSVTWQGAFFRVCQRLAFLDRKLGGIVADPSGLEIIAGLQDRMAGNPRGNIPPGNRP